MVLLTATTGRGHYRLYGGASLQVSGLRKAYNSA